MQATDDCMKHIEKIYVVVTDCGHRLVLQEEKANR